MKASSVEVADAGLAANGGSRTALARQRPAPPSFEPFATTPRLSQHGSNLGTVAWHIKKPRTAAECCKCPALLLLMTLIKPGDSGMLSGLQTSWDVVLARVALVRGLCGEWVSGCSCDWQYKCPLLSVGLEDPADDGQSHQ